MGVHESCDQPGGWGTGPRLRGGGHRREKGQIAVYVELEGRTRTLSRPSPDLSPARTRAFPVRCDL
jgi:hypothetical protein